MFLNDFIPAWLLFLSRDIISLEVMMIGGLANEFSTGGRTMVLALDKIKRYRKCRFGIHTCY